MPKKCLDSWIWVMMCLLFSLFMISTSFFAQEEKKVDPKILDELVGGYEVKIQGQSGIFVFIAEEGKLKGAPAGDKPTVLEPVEGEGLTFVGYAPDGAEQFFKFLRDDEGNVAKCILSIPALGLVADMFKIKK